VIAYIFYFYYLNVDLLGSIKCLRYLAFKFVYDVNSFWYLVIFLSFFVKDTFHRLFPGAFIKDDLYLLNKSMRF
jgi:hypothetical protein